MDEELKDFPEGYKKTDSYETAVPRIVNRKISNGEVSFVEESQEHKTIGNKVVETTEGVVIDYSDAVKVEKKGNDYYVVFKDGEKQKVTKELGTKLITNGINSKTFVPVTGVRKTETYEKIKEKSKTALMLVVLVPLIISMFSLRQCGKKAKNDGVEPTPPSTIGTIAENISEEDLNYIMDLIYENKANEILDTMNPSLMLRVTQDALMAADFDVELMGSDLWENDKYVYDNYVNPGAKYVEQINAVKENIKMSPLSPEEKLQQALSLLDEYMELVNVARKSVDGHIKTTDMVIEKGIKGDNYENELVILEGQKEEIAEHGDYLSDLKNSSLNIEQLKADLKSGLAKFKINENGSVTIYTSQNEVIFLKNVSKVEKKGL